MKSKTEKYFLNELHWLRLKSYLRRIASPLATEAFRGGETGVSPKNTSKIAVATLMDSIVASALESAPLDEIETWKYTQNLSLNAQKIMDF